MATLFSAGLFFLLVSGAAAAPTASDLIRAGEIVTHQNLALKQDSDGQEARLLGREARRTIYAGQPVTLDNTRPARLVARNQIVTLRYQLGGLEITTTGRSMGEASLDETVSVLNLQSRKIIQGIVQENGWVLVQ